MDDLNIRRTPGDRKLSRVGEPAEWRHARSSREGTDALPQAPRNRFTSSGNTAFSPPSPWSEPRRGGPLVLVN